VKAMEEWLSAHTRGTLVPFVEYCVQQKVLALAKLCYFCVVL
jgi:hypothetical protein